MSQLTVMTFVVGLAVWFAIGAVVSMVFGRIVRARDLQRARPDEHPGAWLAWDDDEPLLLRNGTR